MANEQFPAVLWGQADYVARMQSYLALLRPESPPAVFSFPLAEDKPDGTRFAFGRFDDALARLPRDVCFGVIFSDRYRPAACEKIRTMGFSNLWEYTAQADNVLKTVYFRKLFAQEGRPFFLLSELEDAHAEKPQEVRVYMAKCVFDKPMRNMPQTLSHYITPIQVGAALCKERIADCTDDTGENISARNRRYSEMTAFYWMWKNDARADYLGLCHYRRHWKDIDRIAAKLRTTEVDAVLPLPTLAERSVFHDYLQKHIPAVWRPMMEVLREQSPEYYHMAWTVFRRRVFYASNMCIVRRAVLDDLCAWMFPVVMEIEHRVGDLADPYYNRYAGFVTERLITLYFLYNKQHWRIAHAEKVFLS
ncbi:DUF4422 domain-containing protein [uncultured Selenomonas sp.]|uniref:DUF4422 domain-containing protein n=1 Tax=uncultured Selenomonas sp. TaxID=159275 RepID=UPI0025D70B71|nr:DUF4422 domain-containing protein [uncultured Selenomonas sp.]